MAVLISAVIRPHKLEEVREALTTMGVGGLTVTQVQGFGRQRGHTEVYRGTEYAVDFVPKVKVELLAPDREADEYVKVIMSAAQTGQIGDGKVWVVDLNALARIRTGEMGDDAL